MRIIGNSHIGMVRSENQDAFLVNQISPDRCIGIVCDGMGGAKGGRMASTIAIDTLRELLLDHAALNDPKSFLHLAAKECNSGVYEVAQNNDTCKGMGTTLVAAIVNDRSVSLINVGDSRAYHITNGKVSQVTKDHSAVQELVDGGYLTEAQAKIHPNKNIITRAIGIEPEVEADYYSIEVEKGDIIILCSDGLSNFADENEIQFEVSGGMFDDLTNRLIDLANSRGGADNITVVAIEI